MLSSAYIYSGCLELALKSEHCVKEDGGMKKQLSDSIGKKNFYQRQQVNESNRE